jgi:pyrimidine-specific ribonucleoside hydrolase
MIHTEHAVALRCSRRFVVRSIAHAAASLVAGAKALRGDDGSWPAAWRVPVIDVTDLYHPHQDVGDNVDLLTAYALPEIDLRAVILDVTEEYRHASAEAQDPAFRDPTGPRDPGFIPVTQLNYLFGRDVPCAAGPFRRMKTPADTMRDVPPFQQFGVELILRTLRQSDAKIEIVSFGSARPVAVAFNRQPELCRAKVARVHLCAGASSPDFLEWNVMLDPHAVVRLLRSDLPVAIYPCATREGPFAYGANNCYWKMENLRFVAAMDPKLKNYLAFAFGRSSRMDYLRFLDEPTHEEILKDVYGRAHNVWETSVWSAVSGRRLVRRADGHYQLVPQRKVRPTDRVMPSVLRPCRVDVRDNGLYRFEWTDAPTNFLMYDRGDPRENERALREALPALYQEFKTS